MWLKFKILIFFLKKLILIHKVIKINKGNNHQIKFKVKVLLK